MVNLTTSGIDMSEIPIEVALAKIDGKLDLITQDLKHKDNLAVQDRAKIDSHERRLVALETINHGRKTLVDTAKYIWGISGFSIAVVAGAVLRKLGV